MTYAAHLGHVVRRLEQEGRGVAPGEDRLGVGGATGAGAPAHDLAHEPLVEKPGAQRVEGLVQHEQAPLACRAMPLQPAKRLAQVCVMLPARGGALVLAHGEGEPDGRHVVQQGRMWQPADHAGLAARSVLQELHHAYGQAGAKHAKGKPHRRRGLALAIAMVQVQHGAGPTRRTRTRRDDGRRRRRRACQAAPRPRRRRTPRRTRSPRRR